MDNLKSKGSRNGIFRSFLLITGVILWFAASLVTGCVTTEEVTSIVKRSNESMLLSLVDASASALPGASLPSANAEVASGGRWEEDSARIDAYIAAHPGQDALASALRIRQAMLLLTYGQYNLANASFEMVDPAHLFTARDKALYTLRRHMIWWFAQDKTLFHYPDDFQMGSDALREFQKTIDTLNDSPEIRDYLAEVQAYIALQMALRITNVSEQKKYFGDGINRYAEIFTDEDLKVLLAHKDDKKALLNNRRQIRALAVIEKAKAVCRGQPELVNEVNKPSFRALLK